jgi:hypothetical protein
LGCEAVEVARIKRSLGLTSEVEQRGIINQKKVARIKNPWKMARLSLAG